MAIYDWPTYQSDKAFWPKSVEYRQWHNQLEHESQLSGDVQTQGSPGSRWGMIMNFAEQNWAERDRLMAFLTRLSGRQHRARIFPPHEVLPSGSLRGTPTLQSAAAQFATTVTLAGCFGRNRLLNSSFEVDSNSDGLSDSWLSAAFGTTGAITNSRTGPSPVPTSTFQRVRAAGLGSTVGDQAGVQQLLVNVADLVGQPVTFSAYLALSAGAFTFELRINFITAGGGFISASSATFVDSSGAFVRRSVTATVPATAATCTVFVVMKANTGGGACQIDIDGCQLEAGSMSDYEVSASLLGGDWLAFNNQLVQVVAPAQANAAAQMTVEFRHMLRAAASAGIAVTTAAPTGLFILQDTTLPAVYDSARAAPMSIEWREVFA